MPNDLYIEEGNCWSIIKSNFPFKLVDKALSFYKNGAHFSSAFKKKRWDGRERLYYYKDISLSCPCGCSFPITRINLVKYIKCPDCGRDGEFIASGFVKFPTGLIDILNGELVKYSDFRLKIINKTVKPDVDFQKVSLPNKQLWDYQESAVNDVVSSRMGILDLATNAGKTEIAISLTKGFGLRTLFLVRGKDALHQARRRFAEGLELSQEDIGIIGDGDFSTKKVTIASVDSLSLEKEEVRVFLSTIEMVFADECHKAASARYYKVLCNCPAYYRIGLSGTPLRRSDGDNTKIVACFGGVISSVKNKDLIEKGVSMQGTVYFVRVEEPDLQEFVYDQGNYIVCNKDETGLIPIKNGLNEVIGKIRETKSKKKSENGDLFKEILQYNIVGYKDLYNTLDEAARVLMQKHGMDFYNFVYDKGVVNNVWANKAIACIIEKYVVHHNYNVMVFVGKKEHGEKISDAIWTTSFVPHAFIHGEDTTEIRQQALQDFRENNIKVLIAPNIFNDQIDLANIDVIILAGRGKSDIMLLQRIGRGLRKGGLSDKLLVFDFMDMTNKYLKKQSLERLNLYKEENCFRIEKYPDPIQEKLLLKKKGKERNNETKEPE